jgi:hypothetical protein
MEIILEIYWITLLLKKYSFFQEKNFLDMAQKTSITKIFPPKKNISRSSRDFRKYHTLYHQSILSLFVYKEGQRVIP